MRPPICAYCHRRNSEEKVTFRTVMFALTSEEKAFNDRMIANRMVGHKKGLEWFCEDHLAVAKKYKHLHYRDAMTQIRKDIKEEEQ